MAVEVDAERMRRAGVTQEQLYEELEQAGYVPSARIVDGDVANVTFVRPV